jgi:hypothetical protein
MPAGALYAMHRPGEKVSVNVDAKPVKNVNFPL